MKTIKDVWQNLESGRVVYAGNKAYRLTMENARGEYQEKHFTYKNGYVLRVTCTSNWFGSLLNEKELSTLFTEENY